MNKRRTRVLCLLLLLVVEDVGGWTTLRETIVLRGKKEKLF